jgi:hypothetical protein
VGPKRAMVGVSIDSVRSVKSILSYPRLNISDENDNLISYYIVQRFYLGIFNESGELLEQQQNNSSMLSKKEIIIIRELRPGSILKFSEIIGTCPDCRNFKLKEIQITIQ